MDKAWAKAGLLAAALAWSPAQAAGTATIEAGGEEHRTHATLEYRDGQLRMDAQVQNQLPATVIVRDGEPYVLVNNLVLDASQALRLIGPSLPVPGTGPVNFRRFLALEATGRSEIVAGIGGQVHRLRYEDGEGRPQAEEMVLSADPRAVELSGAMLRMGEILRTHLQLPRIPDEQRLQAAIRGKGVLRYGRDFRVLAVNANPPPPERFELPFAPLQWPPFGRLDGGAASPREALDQLLGGE